MGGHMQRECPDRNTGGFRNNSGGNQACYRCGKHGHMARECEVEEDVCYNCGSTGHIKRECTESLKKETCNGCGDEGHYQRDCPTKTTGNGGVKCYKCENLGQ